MRKAIEWDTSEKKQPMQVAKTQYDGPSFKSLILRDDLYKRKKKFGEGESWLRFLPSITGSKYEWMMRLDVYTVKTASGGVTFVSPNTFDERAENPFVTASKWLRKNKPEVLSNKDSNPDGLRLYPSPQGLSWVIDEKAPEGERLSLYLASMYDGSRGGTTGAAYRVKSLAEEKDTEPGSPTLGELIYGDITHPETGRLVKISVTKPKGQEFQSYTMAIGQKQSPLEASLKALTDEEHNLIAPLDRVVYVPTVEEIHEILKGYIGAELYTEIFG
jgi:hypothetical protein